MIIKEKEDIKAVKEGGKILAGMLKKLAEKSKPGVTTNKLNEIAENLIFKAGVKPAFKGYGGFPKALVTSINEEIVHAVPSERALKEGDILSLDFGIKYKGFFVDSAITVAVGEIDLKTARLIRVTRKALKRGIKNARPGKTVGDIGNAIERYVSSQSFGVVKELVGHGIGKELHEAPQIPNFGKRHTGYRIKEGMLLAIEPMVTTGDWRIKEGSDGFAFVTGDNSLSAHFEHTVLITQKGPDVLTE